MPPPPPAPPPVHRPEELVIPADFVCVVDEVQTALEFKRALEAASLDNGDLDEDDLFRLRNPVTEIVDITDKDILTSLRLLLLTTNTTDQAYKDFYEILKMDSPDRNFLSLYSVKKKIAELTGVHPIFKDMCNSSCMGFTGPWSDLDACPLCGLSRYDTKGKSRQHFMTIPIGPQLQALWRTTEGAHDMGDRVRRTDEIFEELAEDPNIKIFTDYCHGHDYLAAVERGDIKTDDMVLMFSMDGAQLYQDKKSDCWIYIWVIYDLPPHLRYKKRHVLPGGFIPGPNNPKNTDSFLFPGFHHLAALQKEGLPIWNAISNRLFLSHLFLHLAGADGPGSVHFTGLVGHQGAYPCRLYCGIKGRHKEGAPQYYPALLKPDGYEVVGCNHGDIDPTEVRNGNCEVYCTNLSYLLHSRNVTDYKTRRRDTGIVTISLFSGLPPTGRLPLPSGFPGDVMHVTTLNLGELLVPLWRGSFTCASTDNVRNWPWTGLKDERVWNAHGMTVAACKPFIPTSYDRPPRNIKDKINSGYKAKEWQGYFYGLGPALLHDLLPLRYWRNFCKLVRAIQLLHRHSIKSEQVKEAYTLMCDFHREFELIYGERRIDRIHFIRPCLHALIHIPLETVRLGPVPLHSCWTMERLIGDLGREIAQPSNPYHNLAERGLRRCQINTLKASFPAFREEEKGLPPSSRSLGAGYALLCTKERTPKILAEPQQAQVIKEFFVSEEARHGNAPPAQWTGPRVQRWARLRLPNGQTARSIWKEDRMTNPDLRRASCVKVSLILQLIPLFNSYLP